MADVAELCPACGTVTRGDDEPCPCEPPPPKLLLTPVQAEQLAMARWSAVSLERIADALEELCTWKEEERRERNEREARAEGRRTS